MKNSDVYLANFEKVAKNVDMITEQLGDDVGYEVGKQIRDSIINTLRATVTKDSLTDLEEYISEAEHADGYDVWFTSYGQFSDILTDFSLYYYMKMEASDEID